MWALVTGASSGIGAEFTEQLAKQGYDLILVARDSSRLHERAQELTNRYNITCEVLVADLSIRSEVKRVEDRLAAGGIEFLVNNAGFGLNKRFADGDIEHESANLEVLVHAVMRLTYAALPFMREQQKGYIVNVSSVASWIAGGTYSASKSWVTIFSEYLSVDMARDGINVTALAPGFTHTEFHQRGKMNMSGIPKSLWLNVDHVVAAGIRAVQRNQAIAIPGRQYRLLTLLIRHLPRSLVRKVGIGVRRRQRR
jgi:short-subunit dehydrogenase